MDPTPITPELCQTAISKYAAELSSLPGVQGLGVKQPPAGGQGDCAVAVYVDTDDHVEGIPDHVVLRKHRLRVRIPVEPVVIGVVRPE